MRKWSRLRWNVMGWAWSWNLWKVNIPWKKNFIKCNTAPSNWGTEMRFTGKKCGVVSTLGNNNQVTTFLLNYSRPHYLTTVASSDTSSDVGRFSEVNCRYCLSPNILVFFFLVFLRSFLSSWGPVFILYSRSLSRKLWSPFNLELEIAIRRQVCC